MKTFIVFTVLAIIVSCIKSSFTSSDIQSKLHREIIKEVRGYCDLSVESRKMFRFCVHENGVWMGSELYRNCAQQLKFAHTFEELDKFVCQRGTKLESLFFKCFIPAYSIFILHNPKTVPVVGNCLSNEDNSGFHTEDHIKGEYHL